MHNTNRLSRHYNEVVAKDLAEYSYCNNSLTIPKLERVVVGLSLRNLGFQVSYIPAALTALYMITEQVPKLNRTVKAVSSYRRMKGDIVGVQTTRTGSNMYGFVDQLVMLVRPQLRPFSGFDVSMVDKKGNLTIPMVKPMVFPAMEKHYENFLPLCSKQGMYITIETNCNSREEGVALLTSLQIPLVGSLTEGATKNKSGNKRGGNRKRKSNK